MQSPNVKGAVAELAIELAATKLGIPVLKPVAEHGRFDLGFEIGERIFRVQVKTPRLAGEGSILIVLAHGNRLTPSGYVRTPYKPGEIDLLAAYSPDLDRCYLLPAELVVDRGACSFV